MGQRKVKASAARDVDLGCRIAAYLNQVFEFVHFAHRTSLTLGRSCGTLAAHRSGAAPVYINTLITYNSTYIIDR